VKVKIVTKQVDIHTVPLYKLKSNDNGLHVEFDDIYEERWRLSCFTVQGFRTTTIDCFDHGLLLVDEAKYYDKNGDRRYNTYILELEDSEWISELKKVLYEIDPDANFLDKSHHLLLDLGDDVLEILTWDNYKLEKIK